MTGCVAEIKKRGGNKKTKISETIVFPAPDNPQRYIYNLSQAMELRRTSSVSTLHNKRSIPISNLFYSKRIIMRLANRLFNRVERAEDFGGV